MCVNALGLDFGVTRIGSCELRVIGGAWEYALARAGEIERTWERALRDNPGYFNGTIYLMADAAVVGEKFTATLLKTDFRSYLHWRMSGFESAGVADGFGSGIIRSKEGDVILGRQAAGHVNAGLAYMPGGFIDERDVGEDGRVDIDGSISREVLEETGQDVDDMERLAGYYVTRHGVQISIGIEYRCKLSSNEICAQIAGHLGSQAEPELAEVCVVRGPPQCEAGGFAPFCVPLLGAVFARL